MPQKTISMNERKSSILSEIYMLEWDLQNITNEDVKTAKMMQVDMLKKELESLKEEKT